MNFVSGSRKTLLCASFCRQRREEGRSDSEEEDEEEDDDGAESSELLDGTDDEAEGCTFWTVIVLYTLFVVLVFC